MTAPNKARGNALEREVVKKLLAKGIKAKRAYASNGESLGQHCEVDVLVPRQTMIRSIVVDGTPVKMKNALLAMKLQCKRKKVLPKWLGLTEHVDAAVFKQDRGTIYITMRLDEFIDRIL